MSLLTLGMTCSFSNVPDAVVCVSVIQLLERHFGAAVSEASRQQLDIAKLHAATVTATLNAINAYAEWAPVPDLSKYGLIHGYDMLKHFIPLFHFSCK